MTTEPAARGDAIAVRHDARAGRFEAEVDGLPGLATYRLVDGVMRIDHTEVAPQLEGRGVASRIVREALAYAEANGLRVEPWCSYVRGYMKRHPETHKLLPDGFVLR